MYHVSPDVYFILGNVTVKFIRDYDGTGWPGMSVTIDGETIKCPLNVAHAVQLQQFMFSSLVQKLDTTHHAYELAKAEIEQYQVRKDADVIPFKFKGPLKDD